jgi:hypothetical protein
MNISMLLQFFSPRVMSNYEVKNDTKGLYQNPCHNKHQFWTLNVAVVGLVGEKICSHSLINIDTTWNIEGHNFMFFECTGDQF